MLKQFYKYSCHDIERMSTYFVLLECFILPKIKLFFYRGLMGLLSKKVGKRIKELREQQNIKQYELAEMLNMEPSNLTRIESGYQMPKEDNISKIAVCLGVQEKDLFDFSETTSKAELIDKITKFLKNSTKEKVEYYYKLLEIFK